MPSLLPEFVHALSSSSNAPATTTTKTLHLPPATDQCRRSGFDTGSACISGLATPNNGRENWLAAFAGN
jgi:hypothetical protein